MTRSTAAYAFALCLLALPGRAAAQSIDDMEQVRFNVPVTDAKAPRGKAELVDGKDDKAVKFTFDDNCQSAFFTKRVSPGAAWDAAAGRRPR